MDLRHNVLSCSTLNIAAVERDCPIVTHSPCPQATGCPSGKWYGGSGASSWQPRTTVNSSWRMLHPYRTPASTPDEPSRGNGHRDNDDQDDDVPDEAESSQRKKRPFCRQLCQLQLARCCAEDRNDCCLFPAWHDSPWPEVINHICASCHHALMVQQGREVDLSGDDAA